MNRNPDSPWIPEKLAELTPEKFEMQVVDWLQATGHMLDNFKVTHRKNLSGPGGDYEFDAVVECTVLGGAQLTILVECKRHSRPIEREKIISIYGKFRDVEANKAMVFSTSGFQSGAIRYATSKKIALVKFIDGSFLYQTRSADSSDTDAPPPPWTNLPEFAGIFMESKKDGIISCKVIDMRNTEVLSEWIQS